jgi:RNA polymerase sigma factor (sigma-70 family)
LVEDSDGGFSTLLTDGQLLEQFVIAQDAESFDALMRRHGPRVQRTCQGILGRTQDAEDAFQATFLVLVRNAGTIREPEAVGVWLCEVAHRVALRAKVRGLQRSAQGLDGVEELASKSSDPDAFELRPLLHAELDRLPERFRTPLVLCYFEGETVEGAARRLQCPLGTLKGRLARGRELLRSRLVRRGIAVSPTLLLLVLGRGSEASEWKPGATGEKAGGTGPGEVVVLGVVRRALLAACGFLALAGVVRLEVWAFGLEEYYFPTQVARIDPASVGPQQEQTGPCPAALALVELSRRNSLEAASPRLEGSRIIVQGVTLAAGSTGPILAFHPITRDALSTVADSSSVSTTAAGRIAAPPAVRNLGVTAGSAVMPSGRGGN